MIDIKQADLDEIFKAQQLVGKSREEMMAQARKFLYDNQECYVAQWVLQNPFVDFNNYRLKFVYTDQSIMGYTVEMEKIEDVQ